MLAEAAGAALLALAGRRIWAAYRLVQEASLGRLAYGLFLLAGSHVAALLLVVSVLLAGDSLPERIDHFDVLFWAYYGTMIGGLVGVFWSFGRHPFRWAPALTGVLAVIGPVLEIVTIVALFFVVLHAGLNHLAQKGLGSGRVAVGFFFVFTAHTLGLANYSPILPRTWVGELVNLVGVLILFYAVARPRTVPNA